MTLAPKTFNLRCCNVDSIHVENEMAYRMFSHLHTILQILLSSSLKHATFMCQVVIARKRPRFTNFAVTHRAFRSIKKYSTHPWKPVARCLNSHLEQLFCKRLRRWICTCTASHQAVIDLKTSLFARAEMVLDAILCTLSLCLRAEAAECHKYRKVHSFRFILFSVIDLTHRLKLMCFFQQTKTLHVSSRPNPLFIVCSCFMIHRLTRDSICHELKIFRALV